MGGLAKIFQSTPGPAASVAPSVAAPPDPNIAKEASVKQAQLDAQMAQRSASSTTNLGGSGGILTDKGASYSKKTLLGA